MRIPLEKFENWLINKRLKERTINEYLYYFNKFNFEVFNQETVSRFLSDKTNRNSIGRSFLVNFQKFLMVNYSELGLSREARLKIAEVELPKLTGREKTRIVKPIPHSQIPLIEAALKTEQLKLMALITYYGGLRLGELLKINMLSFNWDSWKKDTSKMGECRVFGKGDKEGIAILPPSLMKRIAVYIRSRKNLTSFDSKLFIRGSENLTAMQLKNKSRTWQNKLKEAGIKAGITKLDSEGNPIKETVVHPHRLRHSWGAHLLKDKEMDIREIQEVLRHSSLQSTQIYTQVSKEHLKDKLSK